MPASCFIELSQQQQDELKQLVWQVLRNAVKTRTLMLPQAPEHEALLQPAASFVTLYIGDDLRGCIGSCTAELPLWQSVCQHSFSSAFEDWRFPPLDEQELAELRFDISILSPLEPIENQGEQALLAALRPGIDGLILQLYSQRAVFLPSVWRSLDTPLQFVRALKQKGGWPEDYWHPNMQLFRFTTYVIS